MDYTDQIKILPLLPLDTIERECERASINGMSSVIALRPRQEARGKRQKFTITAFQVLSMSNTLMGSAILVLDEATEGIQPSIILEIEAAVRRIIETTGISVLLVEHHLHFVRQADRYYAMQKGGIVASGATS